MKWNDHNELFTLQQLTHDLEMSAETLSIDDENGRSGELRTSKALLEFSHVALECIESGLFVARGRRRPTFSFCSAKAFISLARLFLSDSSICLVLSAKAFASCCAMCEGPTKRHDLSSRQKSATVYKNKFLVGKKD